MVMFLCKVVNTISELLNEGDKLQVYVGLTGILIAIVIFVVEVISKHEKHKIVCDMLQKTTMIKFNTILMISNLFAFWIINCLNHYYIVYSIFDIILDVFIIVSFILTMKMWIIVLNINTNIETFNKYLINYLISLFDKYNKKRNKYDKDKNEFYNFIQSSKIFDNYYNYRKSDENNKTIYKFYSKKSGYVVKVDENLLKNLEKKIFEYNHQKITNYTYIDNMKIVNESDGEKISSIYFTNDLIGKKVDERSILFYYEIDRKINDVELSEDIKELINKIRNSIIIKTECNQEILNTTINSFLDYSFEKEDRLFLIDEFYKKVLSKNKNYIFDVNDLFKKYLEKNEYSGMSTDLLLNLKKTAMAYNNIECINFFLNLIEIYFIREIYFEKDDSDEAYQKIAYDYVNDFFMMDIFYLESNYSKENYLKVMLSLLKIVENLLAKNHPKAIETLFENMWFIHDYSINNNVISEKEKIDFEFALGLYYYISAYNKRFNNIDESIHLIEKVKEKNVKIDKIEVLVLLIKERLNNKDELLESLSYRSFERDNHKYLNNYDCEWIEPIDTLYGFILDLKSYLIDEEYLKKIDYKDKQIYVNMKKTIQNNFCQKIIEKNNAKKEIEEIAKSLDKCIEKCNELEQHFYIDFCVDNEYLELFKNKILTNLRIKNTLIGILKLKVEKKRECLKNYLGVIRSIPKEFFARKVADQFFTEDLTDPFNRAYDHDIINCLNNNAIEKNETLEEYLKTLKDDNKYILFTNYDLLFRNGIYLNDNNEYILLGNKKVKVIFSFEIKTNVLVKIDSLPKVYSYEFSEEFDKESVHTEKGINYFYELIDCSKNDKIRKELIDNDKDPDKEKLEQKWKSNMYFRLLSSIKIEKNNNNEIFKFEHLKNS